ncbi:hypothetical protein I7I48_06108 [Histoplasma ohiense]|nr:hypothetical protein I7I48_06108 [Histoplasma ohiense (nom. inval.)]
MKLEFCLGSSSELPRTTCRQKHEMLFGQSMYCTIHTTAITASGLQENREHKGGIQREISVSVTLSKVYSHPIHMTAGLSKDLINQRIGTILPRDLEFQIW